MPELKEGTILFDADYPEQGVVLRVNHAVEGGRERGYLTSEENGVVKFVPEFDRGETAQ